MAGDVLFVGGRIAVALRAGTATVFLRSDLPAELTSFRDLLERALVADGLQALDTDSSLAKPLARELLGMEGARWDLWGQDLAEVFGVMAARAGGTGATASSGYASAPGAPPAASAASAETTSGRTGSAGAGTPSPDPAAPAGRRPPPKILLVLGLVLLLAVAAAVFITVSAQDDEPPVAEPGSSLTPVPQAPLVDYVDPAGRFSLKYPETWRPVELSNPEVALLLLGPEGASMLVRLVTLEKPVDVANIPDVKAVTDLIVQTPSVQIIQERPIDLPEAKGYYYLYRFQDQASQQQGVHSHFFLFRGASLHTLVFQALPFEKFPEFASDFDRIAQSYRIIS